MLTISVNAARLMAGLSAAQKGTGFAATVALTRTARAVTPAFGREVTRVFDRPTPTTQNAFYWQPATKDRTVLTIGIKDFLPKGTAAAKYLLAEIEGGSRRLKRSERQLSRSGIMGNRGFWVPGAGLRLNAYGNVTGPQMVRILSAVKAFGEEGYLGNVTARSKRRTVSARAGERYFVPRPGSGLAPGVWLEKGSGKRRRIVPILLFVPTVSYRKRFDFFGLGERLVRMRYPQELRQAIAEGWNLPKR